MIINQLKSGEQNARHVCRILESADKSTLEKYIAYLNTRVAEVAQSRDWTRTRQDDNLIAQI